MLGKISKDIILPDWSLLDVFTFLGITLILVLLFLMIKGGDER